MNADGEEKTRVFMGLSLSSEVRRYVADIAQNLSGLVQEVRWVAPENLHVTLKFIGYCGEDRLVGILEVMRDSSRYLPLVLKVGGFGGFPSQGSARVIWVGAEDEGRRINELHRFIEKGVEKLGFPREKRSYTPHITIGRAKNKPVKLPTGVDGVAGPGETLRVEDIVLFRSLLKKTGAEYSVIERVGIQK